MSGIRFKFFAEHTHLDLERAVNNYNIENDIQADDYIAHDFIADGLEKPYNMSFVHRVNRSRKFKYWWNRVFGRR